MTTADRALAARLDEAAEECMRLAWSRNDAHSLGIGANLASEASTALTSALDEIERLEKALDMALSVLNEMTANGMIVTTPEDNTYGTYFVEQGVFDTIASLHRSGR